MDWSGYLALLCFIRTCRSSFSKGFLSGELGPTSPILVLWSPLAFGQLRNLQDPLTKSPRRFHLLFRHVLWKVAQETNTDYLALGHFLAIFSPTRTSAYRSWAYHWTQGCWLPLTRELAALRSCPWIVRGVMNLFWRQLYAPLTVGFGRQKSSVIMGWSGRRVYRSVRVYRLSLIANGPWYCALRRKWHCLRTAQKKADHLCACLRCLENI